MSTVVCCASLSWSVRRWAFPGLREAAQGRPRGAGSEHEVWSPAPSLGPSLHTSGRYSGLKGGKRLKDAFGKRPN